MKSIIALSACFALRAQATAINTRYTPPNANCVDYDIPVSFSTTGVSFVAPKWNDTYGLVDFVSVAASRMNPTTKSPIAPGASLQGNYTLSATFCSPRSTNSHTNTVLLATHGLGFEREYWNSAFEPENYNFVQFAVSKGYSVFFYDRLGTGKSSVGKISGYVNQAANQQNILGYLSSQLKQGKYTGSLGNASKVVLVGHSFGSFISNGLLAASPNSADGVVLTGLAYNLTPAVNIEAFNPRVSTEQDMKFAGRDTGYITWVDVIANINNFFKAPYYTKDATDYAEKTKQPFAIAELLSISTITYSAPQFQGPVLVFNGEYDFIVCSGYCPDVNEQPARTYFSGSKAFKAATQPGTGHGLTLHKNATAGYAVITDFLASNGL